MLRYEIQEAPGYFIQEDGQVWSVKSSKYMAQRLNSNGYYIVELTISKGRRKKFYIHRLLGQYFIPNDDPLHKTDINHKDENKTNNNLNNLEWIGRIENLNYGTAQERSRIHRTIQVDMLDNQKNILRTFDSAKDAAEFVHRAPGTLTPALKNPNRTCGGYYWQYHNSDISKAIYQEEK